MILLVVVFTLTITSTAQSKASLETFWNKFRPLLIENKFKALAAHVKFPLNSKGVFDGMKVIKITKTTFASAMTKFLNLEHMDTEEGTSDLVITKHSSYYAKITDLNDEKITSISGKWARIGDLEFSYIGNKWMLTTFYDGRTE
jgi:hypothetical protein